MYLFLEVVGGAIPVLLISRLLLYVTKRLGHPYLRATLADAVATLASFGIAAHGGGFSIGQAALIYISPGVLIFFYDIARLVTAPMRERLRKSTASERWTFSLRLK